MAQTRPKRILITGGSTPLGINLAAALLAEGAEVTLLVREGTQDRLGEMARSVQVVVADVWDTASLRGRSRNHDAVIHAVGSTRADPQHGLTFQRLNTLSARNVLSMCISDGVPLFILLSAAHAPWMGRAYIASKRQAEAAIRRSGVPYCIVRAPLVYLRGQGRPLFYRLMELLCKLPPWRWLGTAHAAPIAADVFARAVARIAIGYHQRPALLFAPRMRRLNSRAELRGQAPVLRPALPFDAVSDEIPFAWLPPKRPL